MDRFKAIATLVLFVLALVVVFSSYYIINPGQRGVLVTLGSVHSTPSQEGFGIKMPFVTTAYLVDIRQQTRGMKSECYSIDLQQVTAELKVLYRIPEESVVSIFQKYAGDPFESLIEPRVNEAFKEVAAQRSAENLVKEREQVKDLALASLRKKVGTLLIIDDLVISNLDLSKDLENAIESKMVQEQEKEKAEFTKQKAEIDAQTAFIRAQGEAKAINIRGEALRNNPSIVDLTIAEHWNGITPSSVVVTRGGSNILLPLHTAADKNGN